jgi:hypothetical protein
MEASAIVARVSALVPERFFAYEDRKHALLHEVGKG